MSTTTATDAGVAIPLALGALAVVAAAGMAVFGVTGQQVAAGGSFAAAMVAGTLAVAAYHVYGSKDGP